MPVVVPTTGDIHGGAMHGFLRSAPYQERWLSSIHQVFFYWSAPYHAWFSPHCAPKLLLQNCCVSWAYIADDARWLWLITQPKWFFLSQAVFKQQAVEIGSVRTQMKYFSAHEHLAHSVWRNNAKTVLPSTLCSAVTACLSYMRRYTRGCLCYHESLTINKRRGR